MCRIAWSTEYHAARASGLAPPVVCCCDDGRNTRWEDVRFRLEQRAGMVVCNMLEFERVGRRKGRKEKHEGCVIGLRAEDARAPCKTAYVLGPDTDVAKIEGIIVAIRVPTDRRDDGKHLFNTYVPRTHLPEVERIEEEEETAMVELAIQKELGELNKSLAEEERELRARLVTDDAEADRRIAEIQRRPRTAERLVAEMEAEVPKIRTRMRLGSFDMYRDREHHRLVDAHRARYQEQYEGGRRHNGRRATRRCGYHPSRERVRHNYAGELGRNCEPIPWADHPDDTPDDGYVCGRCLNYFTPLHFKHLCPSRDRPGWKPMEQRPQPTGILLRGMAVVAWDAPVELVEAATYVQWTDDDARLLMDRAKHRELYSRCSKPPPPPPPGAY